MANRFWVGGTGTWDSVNTVNWSDSSPSEGAALMAYNAHVEGCIAWAKGERAKLGL